MAAWPTAIESMAGRKRLVRSWLLFRYQRQLGGGLHAWEPVGIDEHELQSLRRLCLDDGRQAPVKTFIVQGTREFDGPHDDGRLLSPLQALQGDLGHPGS